jgi:hypothetical protein
MQAAQHCLRRAIHDLVVQRSRFPAHSAEHADGFHDRSRLGSLNLIAVAAIPTSYRTILQQMAEDQRRCCKFNMCCLWAARAA